MCNTLQTNVMVYCIVDINTFWHRLFTMVVDYVCHCQWYPYLAKLSETVSGTSDSLYMALKLIKLSCENTKNNLTYMRYVMVGTIESEWVLCNVPLVSIYSCCILFFFCMHYKLSHSFCIQSAFFRIQTQYQHPPVVKQQHRKGPLVDLHV